MASCMASSFSFASSVFMSAFSFASSVSMSAFSFFTAPISDFRLRTSFWSLAISSKAFFFSSSLQRSAFLSEAFNLSSSFLNSSVSFCELEYSSPCCWNASLSSLSSSLCFAFILATSSACNRSVSALSSCFCWYLQIASRHCASLRLFLKIRESFSRASSSSLAHLFLVVRRSACTPSRVMVRLTISPCSALKA